MDNPDHHIVAMREEVMSSDFVRLPCPALREMSGLHPIRLHRAALGVMHVESNGGGPFRHKFRVAGAMSS